MTAGLPRKPGMTREDLLSLNAKIINDVSANVKLGETPLLLLPVDPLEKGYRVRQNFPLISMFFSSPEDFVYTFTAGKEGKYKLTAKMESNVGLEKAKDDGGNLDERLEVGSDLKLKP